MAIDFEGITPEQCKPMARRLSTLSIHCERIQWPGGIVQDLKDAAKVLEIIHERAALADALALQDILTERKGAK